MIKNYDPNITWARHSFSLTFMQWDYSTTIEVDVFGNGRGADLFGTAIYVAFDELYGQNDDEDADAVVVLKRGDDTLEITLANEDELAALCVSISIVTHVKELK